MRISETSHPIGFCGAKITLFAPRRMLSPRFSAPFALRRPKIPCTQGKTPRFGAKTLRFRPKYPYFSLPLGTPQNLSFTRAILYNGDFFDRRAIFFSQFLCILNILCIFAERHESSSHHERSKVVLPHRQTTESEALAQPPIRAKDETKALIALRPTLLLKFNPYAKTLFAHSHYGNCSESHGSHSRI